MKNITLPQVVQCKNKSKGVAKIDCQHWTMDNENCSQHCLLKNITVNFNTCYKCDVRKPLTPVDEIKSLIPQTNIYTGSKNGIKFNKELFEQKQSFTQKALSYSKVEGSQLVQGKVSEEVFNKRKQICMTCSQRTNPTPHIDSIGWCKACGCSSKNPRAGLTNKLWMPDWECPQKKFGKEEGQGFNIEDAANSLKGIATSVVSLFKGEGNT